MTLQIHSSMLAFAVGMGESWARVMMGGLKDGTFEDMGLDEWPRASVEKSAPLLAKRSEPARYIQGTLI